MPSKIEIKGIDFACTGSILRLYKRCGKSGCVCQKTKGHGPYFVWTRKFRGKTVTKTLTKKQAKQCREYIKDMVKLRVAIRKLEKKTWEHVMQIKD